MDLVFIMGAGGDEAVQDFAIQKEIVKEITKLPQLSRDSINIGVVVYGQDAKVTIQFNQFDKVSLLRAIGYVRLESIGNDIGKGLQLARSSLFNAVGDDRKDAVKLAVVFYNGPIDASAVDAAKELISDKVSILSVGVGRKAALNDGKRITGNDELSIVAKTPEDVKNVAVIFPSLTNAGYYVFKISCWFFLVLNDFATQSP